MELVETVYDIVLTHWHVLYWRGASEDEGHLNQNGHNGLL